MKRLNTLIIADPSRDAAADVVDQTERLASRRELATSGDEAISLVERLRPEALLLSLELRHPDADKVAKLLKKGHPELFMIASFRELSVPMMAKLEQLGIDEFLPQPIDPTQLFRAASKRFDTPFRRHTRYPVHLEVFRADGVMVGKTRDISEGGLQMDCYHPTHPEQSMLLDITLASDQKLRVRCLVLEVEGEPPTTVIARMQFQNLRGEEHRRLMRFLSGIGK